MLLAIEASNQAHNMTYVRKYLPNQRIAGCQLSTDRRSDGAKEGRMEVNQIPIWGFPKIGDPNIVP